MFAQNHYSYKDNTGHFNPIIWDMNMAFGGFPFAGAGGTSMGSLTIAQMQQFPFDHHATDTFWPLINAVQANATYKRKYVAHMRTILTEFFTNNAYLSMASQLQTTIDTAVQSDTHKFFSYTQFQNGIDSLTDLGSYKIPGIKMLMNARATYLQSTPEFSAVTPFISAISSSVVSPVINTNFDMNATVGNVNANGVTLGYRFDKTQKFEKVAMYDDGAHNDGAANDDVFGVSLTMQGGTMQYYIYAENNNAGIFSPERAEHEFHILSASSQVPTAGQLVINEVLSENVNNEQDEYGNTEDWIEVYNNSNQLLDLSGVYLSDNLSNLNKWKFPASTTINPNSYLTIWADDDSSQQVYHTNFQLNKDSGMVILSNGSAQILDSISFANQSANISFGRYPNGTGNFIPMNTTYGYNNNNFALSIATIVKENDFNLYPNPATDNIVLEFDGEKSIAVYTIQGKQIYSGKGNKKQCINTFTWGNGIYIVKCGYKMQKLIIQQ